MNNIFNLDRFLLLFKKHTIEHGKTYLLSAAVLTGILLIFLGEISYSNHGYLDIIIQANLFGGIMPAVGCIFTSLSFTALGDKKQAISLLTLPASHFEKYLVSWIYTYVIFQLVFIGAFYLVDFIVISCGKPPKDGMNAMYNIFTSNDNRYHIILIYALLHAVTFFGAVFFEKMHFIKTAFVFIIVLIVLGIINAKLQHIIIDKNVLEDAPFTGIVYEDAITRRDWSISAPESIIVVGKSAWGVGVMALWASTFFRLKEKEV